MKKIEFKKLPKQLIEEGITIELLEQVQASGKLSPAMMAPGDDPVLLVKCNADFYWIQLQDEHDTFLRDGKDNLIKFDLKTCIIARARYYLLFSDHENKMSAQRKEKAKDKEIQTEVEIIKRNLTKKINELNEKYSLMEMWAYNPRRSITVTIMENNYPQAALEKKEAAKEWFKQNPGVEQFMESINQQLNDGDFDSLYIALESNGLPLLMTIDNGDPKDIELMKKLFHLEKVSTTIDRMNGRSHIETIAMMKVERRYVQPIVNA